MCKNIRNIRNNDKYIKIQLSYIHLNVLILSSINLFTTFSIINQQVSIQTSLHTPPKRRKRERMKRNSNSVVSPCRISFDRDEDGSSALHKEGKHEVDHLQTAERGREWHAPQRAEAIAGTACCKTQCATFCGGLRRLSVRISRVNQPESKWNPCCHSNRTNCARHNFSFSGANPCFSLRTQSRKVFNFLSLIPAFFPSFLLEWFFLK